MSTISSYPGGFQNGIAIRGVPTLVTAPNNVFWVSSVTGSNADKGKLPNQAYATIDYAVGKCTANKGDVIYVMPGHTETISTAAALDLDVAGITVIGLGSGTDQPRLDFTATASTVTVNASNITIHNINFHSNISGVVLGLSVVTLSTDLTVSNCSFDVEATTTDEFLIAINFGVGCDRFIVENCTMDMGLGGAATGIKLVGATAGGTIRNNRIVGDYSLACIGGLTTASTEIYIEDNTLIQGNSANANAVAAISLVAASTGVISGNRIFSDVATFLLQVVSTGMIFFDNDRTDDVGSATTSAQASASVVASADG